MPVTESRLIWTILTNIKAEMRERGVTAAALAEEIGVSPSTLSRRLAGKTPLLMVELHDIAMKFGMTPVDLLKERA